jgi:hypothetical protein
MTITPGGRSNNGTRTATANSPSELPAALFGRLDANQDGAVSEAELTALWNNR